MPTLASGDLPPSPITEDLRSTALAAVDEMVRLSDPLTGSDLLATFWRPSSTALFTQKHSTANSNSSSFTMMNGFSLTTSLLPPPKERHLLLSHSNYRNLWHLAALANQ